MRSRSLPRAPAQTRQHDVQDRQCMPPLSRDAQGVQSVMHGAHGETLGAQIFAQHVGQFGIIINDQHRAGHVCAAPMGHAANLPSRAALPCHP
ncbi:hypothetical protein E4T56_gene8774 [Termitomyces sp. T112]|nr:hypothetical protein E4T56_gene8774 [Termitomyces sp. T112]